MEVRLSDLRAGLPLPLRKILVLISVRGWVDPRAIVRLKGLGKLKKSTSSGLPCSTIFWYGMAKPRKLQLLYLVLRTTIYSGNPKPEAEMVTNRSLRRWYAVCNQSYKVRPKSWRCFEIYVYDAGLFCISFNRYYLPITNCTLIMHNQMTHFCV
jgi:hypothetical protein